MTKTKQDLAEEVLLELGKADAANPGESAEDIAFVKRRYGSVFLELEDHGLVFWDEDSIPERVFDPLVQLLAFRCRKAFGVEYTLDDAMQRLQALASRDRNAWPVKAEYF